MSRCLVCKKRRESGMEYAEKRPLTLGQAWSMRGGREERAVVNRGRQNQQLGDV